MARKLCELCGVKPATVPNRNRPGRPINRVCSDCHAGRLAGDFQEVVKAAVSTTAERTNKERDEQNMSMNFNKGEKVVKLLRCAGLETASVQEIETVKEGVVKLVGGLTYRDSDGREYEPYPLPGVSSRIVTLEE